MNKERIFLHPDLLERAVGGLDNQKPVLIYGAFGSGKSTFVNKLVAECGARNPEAVWLKFNFSRFPPEAFETIESLWRQMVVTVAETTGQDVSRVVRNLEKGAAFQLTAQITIIEFFGDMLEQLNKPLVLVSENVHEIIGKPYLNSFFDCLRGLNGDREISDRLKIVISMISDFEEITNLATTSPFLNICEPIPLAPLDEQQISMLLSSYESDNSEPTVRQIKELVGGSLYLIKNFLEHLAQTNQDVRRVLESGEAERIFDASLETIRGLIPNDDRVKEILGQFKDTDEISIQFNNLEKEIYDGLSQIGVLNREDKGAEIQYTIQGNRFKELID